MESQGKQIKTGSLATQARALPHFPEMADQVGLPVLELAHMDSGTSNTSSAIVSSVFPEVHVNLELLEAAMSGNARTMRARASEDSRALFAITPLGNACLQKATIHGHEGFSKNVVLELKQSLLTAVKVVGETPLITRSRSSSSGGAPMAGRLLEAATSGDIQSMKQTALDDPGMLLGTTPQGNTCLHIASIHGHEEFCENVLTQENSQELLSVVNRDGETPLLTAVARGHASLASILLGSCCPERLREMILKQDKRGCNVLHHAIRGGQRKLALQLIDAEPALSEAVNVYDESPMFMAAMRNFTDVVEKLLEVPDSAHSGPFGFNALHAAVTNSNPEIAKAIMARYPLLIRQETENNRTPVHLAVSEGKVEMLTVLLEEDRSLGYLISKTGTPLLCMAASEGHVGIAGKLLKHCPDAPYCDATGSTCLHQAVLSGQEEFVEFILASQQLRQLVNMVDKDRETALHLAMERGNKKMVAALLRHREIDVTVINCDCITVLQDGINKLKPSISIPAGSATTDSPGPPGMEMDKGLVEAAISGDSASLKRLFLRDPSMLLATNPQGNNCLHIASIHGHERFCKDAIALDSTLVDAVNIDDETPLLIAVTSGHVALASILLSCCRDEQLSRAILKQDKHGCNALHHAIRSGHEDLALELLRAEPGLSQALNRNNESPMFIAVSRDLENVFEELLRIPYSAHGGTGGYNVLHAAVRNGNPDIVKRIMEARPSLAREEDLTQLTPVHVAAYENKIDILRLFLEYDRSLGYLNPTSGEPLLCTAAFLGYVGVARELLNHCPGAPFRKRINGFTCLHTAVYYGQTEFAEFILRSQKLRKLINMQDESGETALHIAARKCNPKMVAALLQHRDIDITVLSRAGQTATRVLFNSSIDEAKTLNWNAVFMLMLKANPKIEITSNLQVALMNEVTNASRKDVKALSKEYTNNTSIVAILFASISFAAAFTLPGGYSNIAGDEGHPIMARKLAFKAFLISDTLAMCSSLAVVFLCFIAKWKDLTFLLHYRSSTKRLMWFSYMATNTAFATGLYTVLAPRFLGLALAVCLLTVLLPILTMLLGEWPLWKLRIQLNQYKKDPLHMV